MKTLSILIILFLLSFQFSCNGDKEDATDATGDPSVIDTTGDPSISDTTGDPSIPDVTDDVEVPETKDVTGD